MRIFLARSLITILLAPQVLSPSLVFSQQDASQKQQKTSSQTDSGEWKIASPLTVFDQDSAQSPTKQEPTIRVALATDVRTATISTSGHLMNATDLATTLVALDVSRVRLEPRLLSPLPPGETVDAYRIQIAGLPTRVDAEQKSRDVQEATGEESQVAYETETKTWGLLVGARRSQIEAEGVRARLEDAGIDATIAPVEGVVAANKTASTLGTQASRRTDEAPGSSQTQATPAVQPPLAKTSATQQNSGPGTLARNVKPVRAMACFRVQWWYRVQAPAACAARVPR